MLKFFVSYKLSKIQIIIIILSVFFSSCVKTVLPPPPIKESLLRLSQLNRKLINIRVNTISSEYTTGRQFLLVFFPFGRICSERLQDAVFNSLYNTLTENGFKPIEQGAKKTLVITIENLNVFGYDLIAVRRLSASLTLTAELLDQSGVRLAKWQVQGHFANWKEFAFQPQLSYVYEHAIKDAIDKVIQPLLLIN